VSPDQSPAAAASIGAVIARMEEIEATLSPGDGVGYFNRLYLNVTREIRDTLASTTFEAPVFLDALDVTFANLYLEAFDAVGTGAECPTAWAPLFEHRRRTHITPIQFALAGMNAHINHDLPLAVITTATEQAVEPFADCPYQRDFFRVNDALKHVEGKIKSWISVGVVGAVDRALGNVDDALSMWGIHGARRAAWDQAALFWRLREHPRLLAESERTLARLVNLAGRGILV